MMIDSFTPDDGVDIRGFAVPRKHQAPLHLIDSFTSDDEDDEMVMMMTYEQEAEAEYILSQIQDDEPVDQILIVRCLCAAGSIRNEVLDSFAFRRWVTINKSLICKICVDGVLDTHAYKTYDIAVALLDGDDE